MFWRIIQKDIATIRNSTVSKRVNDPWPQSITILRAVYEEAVRREYHFDRQKFTRNTVPIRLTVTAGQLQFERQHLLKKLKQRDRPSYNRLKKMKTLAAHPLFRLVQGAIEDWEVLS